MAGVTTDWREHASSRRARPPQVRGAVARPRLLSLLGASRVVAVVAPAGYGKTTALAAGLPDLGRAAWLTLDADDADPQVLAAGLAVAVAGLPGGEGPGALLDAGAVPRRVAARVADVLDRSGALLVLDEAQHLAGPLTEGVLRELLGGRVALLSRTPLLGQGLTRLELSGDLTRVFAPDLAFTPAELAELLAAQGVVATGAEVRLAHAVTEGWPIAARFLAQAAAQGRVRLSALADLDGGEAQLGTLFAYLAQEVLGPLDPSLRALLTRGSVFEDLTPELIADVLEETQAGTLLGALASGGTFLTRTGDSYRAHPLLRAHLRGLLAPGEARILAARGAAYFERTGRPRQALAAHLTAGNTARAAELLAEHGGRWLDGGRVTLVERSLARVPPDAWTPALHALSGDALRLSSRYAEALAAYGRADPLARSLGEAQVALDTVQPDLAWGPLDTAQTLASGTDVARTERMRAENYLNAGDPARALALHPDLARGARYALRSGRLGDALALALDAARGEAGGARAAQNHREGLLLASFLHAVLGEPGEAARRAREGLAEGERLESLFVRSLALARLGHAEVVAGCPEDARAAYEGALTLAQDVVPRLQVEPRLGLAYLEARAGHPAPAAEHEARALAHAGGDRYVEGLTRLTAALGRLHGGDAAGALPELEAAREVFTACGDAFGTGAAALAVYAATGRAGDAPAAARAAAAFPFLLARRSLLSPTPERAARAALLARLAADAPGEEAGLRPVAHALGYGHLPRQGEVPGVDVRVQVLGRVAVTRGGQAAREWGRARARDLLALLTVHDPGLAREAAQEALFPGADPQVGERNFRVTLHALGQVLEEGVTSGTFLERGEWLRLRGGPDLTVDLWEARAHLGAPPGTPGRAGALLALPGGLADTDLEAVQAEAERYAARLPEALAAEAGHALRAARPDLAARLAERALTLDPAHEPAARALMRAHAARAHPAAAARTYAALRAALADLGLTPLPETEGLHRALTGGVRDGG
ncbi:BTAD domain-containing putative transcriptional regulator [Deinococcus aestuarii]|uniref:BTAD domain-containing putative transcriptional regulator n=1 Tax=Deinococcus aestuarii TaxID=2774531 RepID=UPI001C0D1122|nr:BTAD domain-containing putative transcriptional regulator [Deinococcus aestuarii]